MASGCVRSVVRLFLSGRNIDPDCYCRSPSTPCVMNPSEMQETIDGLRWDLHNLCMLASEPHQTPVHPTGTINRDEVSATQCASDEEVEPVLSEF